MSAHLAHVHWATGDWQAAEAQARHALADGRSGITTKITALIVLGYLGFGRTPAVATAHLAQPLISAVRCASSSGCRRPGGGWPRPPCTPTARTRQSTGVKGVSSRLRRSGTPPICSPSY